MSWSKLLVIALGGVLLAGPAFAQDDDELMELQPKKKPTVQPKPKVKVKPKAVRPPVSGDDELAPLTPSKGELVLKLVPGIFVRRAKVSVDDREIGTLPIPNQALTIGEHTVAVRAPGHVTWTRKVAILANRATELAVTLEANAAIVSVSTDITGAQVSINGKLIGTAPIEELEVAPGATVVSVRKEGYKESSQTLKLVAGKEYPISVKLGAPAVESEFLATSDRPENPNLFPVPSEELALATTVEESRPAHTRWYFWAGLGVVVAVVAVGAVLGVRYSMGLQQRFNEGAICGDDGCDSCIGLMCGMAPSGIVPIKF